MNRVELRKRLELGQFDEGLYFLNGEDPPYAGYVLSENNGKWSIEYIERGISRLISEYKSEAEACEAFYKEMFKDGGTRKRAPRS